MTLTRLFPAFWLLLNCGSAQWNKYSRDCPAPGEAGRQPPSEFADLPDFVELRRTPCYGSCPSYTVRIQSDGRVEWSGDRFIKVVGKETSDVDSEKAKELIQKFLDHGFWQLCGEYSATVTDHPTDFTTVRVAGKVKRVSDYASTAPAWLRELDKEIDALAETHQWRHGDSSVEDFVNLQSDIYLPKPGVTPLMRAAGGDDLKAVRESLSQGSDAKAKDQSDWTALMYAARSGHLQVVRELLTAGSGASDKSKIGQTPIMAAAMAWYEPEPKIQALMAAGGEINAQDREGRTALMNVARSALRIDLLTFLVKAGAHVDIRDAAGLTALDHFNITFAKGGHDNKEYDLAVQLLRTGGR